MNARPYLMANDSPGFYEPGLRRFWGSTPCSHRAPTAFASRLLSQVELDRVADLLRGPQWPVALDRRLINLGLARVALGKVVATTVARTALWRERYEVRRGSDASHLAEVRVIVADTQHEALTAAWALARRDVGEQRQRHLVQEGGDGRWSIILPPVRTWPEWSVRPYVLELQQIQP